MNLIRKRKCLFAGLVLSLIGLVLIIIKGSLPEYIDNSGLLIENFYLLPIGFGLIAVGIIFMAISWFLDMDF